MHTPEMALFPISERKLSLLKISDYWSREIKASQRELLAKMEGAWWLGEIVGDSARNRLELLKSMFKLILESDDSRIVFVAGENAIPPESIKLADGSVVVPDLRPRVCVPSSDTDTWTEASCAATFEALAGLSCFEHYPEIGPGLDYIELTRDEFIRWLEMREFSFPEFWKRPIDRVASLKQASEAVIVKAIKDVYDIARARGEKAPNIKELPGKVRDLLKTKGYTAAVRRIQQLGDNPEFKGCRRKPGKTLSSERRPGGH